MANNTIKPSVVSQPTVGTKTYIREEIVCDNGLKNGKIGFEPLNLNINGSIKLLGDKNTVSTIDAKTLLAKTDIEQLISDSLKDIFNPNTIKGRQMKSYIESIT